MNTFLRSSLLIALLAAQSSGMYGLHPRSPIILAEVESDQDRTITDSVRSVLKATAEITEASKDVIVGTSEGMIMLRGKVKSAQDKNLILRTVRQVSGVQFINDQIQIVRTK